METLHTERVDEQSCVIFLGIVYSTSEPKQGSLDDLLFVQGGRGGSPFLQTSSIHFIEWPGIRKAGVPDLIDDLFCLSLVLAARARHDGADCPAAHTVLEVLCDGPVSPGEGFPRPATLATERGGADLGESSR